MIPKSKKNNNTKSSTPAKASTPPAKAVQTPAPAKRQQEAPATAEDFNFVKELIRDTNKEAGEKIAFNLAEDSAPTNVKRWIPTGSRQLDYIVANRRGGGYPEGRVIEIQGPQANGKSHLAIEASRATQRMGGIVVYIDAENATSLDNLKSLGLDVGKRFVYVQETCMEKIFAVIENVIIKARNMRSDLPILVIWDSVAASSPKAELEGDYEQNTIGLAARVLSKGFRKITHLIGDKNVCLLLINQQRMKIGVMFGDPTVTPGGNAIPYHASLRLRLSGGQQIKKLVNGKELVVGIAVDVKVIKNKVARPWRQCSFEIHFGKGIVESEQLFDELRQYCEKAGKALVNGKHISVSGAQAWKTFEVSDAESGEVLHEIKFQKSTFQELVIDNPLVKTYFDDLVDAAFIIGNTDEHFTFASVDTDSHEEVSAAKLEADGGKAVALLLND